jgi:hypothetical protein
MRRLFEVNSEPHTGARPSVRLCVGLKMHYAGTNFTMKMISNDKIESGNIANNHNIDVLK